MWLRVSDLGPSEPKSVGRVQSSNLDFWWGGGYSHNSCVTKHSHTHTKKKNNWSSSSNVETTVWGAAIFKAALLSASANTRLNKHNQKRGGMRSTTLQKQPLEWNQSLLMEKISHQCTVYLQKRFLSLDCIHHVCSSNPKFHSAWRFRRELSFDQHVEKVTRRQLVYLKIKLSMQSSFSIKSTP